MGEHDVHVTQWRAGRESVPRPQLVFPAMELSRKVGGGPAGPLLVELARYTGVARSHLRDEGLTSTVKRLGRFLRARALRPRTVAQRRGRTFSVGAVTLPYELSRYNGAWLNERSVEISLARHLLSGLAPDAVLEVGNVLPHYDRSGHTVVDKYEAIEGVVNEDILEYQPGRTFDAVVAISTLEHVGFDEPNKNPLGPALALDAMRSHLSPGGFVLVTVPLGYNPGLDDSIATGRFSCSRQFSLRRTSKDNDWVQDSVEAALDADYGSPFPNANAVYIGLDGPGTAAVRL